MSFDPIYLIYGIIFIGTMLLVDGVYHLLMESGKRGTGNVNRRLRMLATGGDQKDVMLRLKREKGNAGFLRNLALVSSLDKLIGQAGYTMSIQRFLLVCLGIAGALYGLLVFLSPSSAPVAPFLAIVGGTVLPVLFLKSRKTRRIDRFGEQLPEAIDVMVRSLRAGHPISTSIALVAKEMADPIGTEFGIVVDETTYGLDLQQALFRLAERIPTQDLNYMVIAMSIQSGTGGNLSEILANLSHVIRDRFRMFKKVQALSAEGKMSASVISALPFIAFGVIHLMNPNYFGEHMDNPVFLMLIGGGFAGLLLGIAIMYKMIKFRV